MEMAKICLLSAQAARGLLWPPKGREKGSRMFHQVSLTTRTSHPIVDLFLFLFHHFHRKQLNDTLSLLPDSANKVKVTAFIPAWTIFSCFSICSLSCKSIPYPQKVGVAEPDAKWEHQWAVDVPVFLVYLMRLHLSWNDSFMVSLYSFLPSLNFCFFPWVRRFQTNTDIAHEEFWTKGIEAKATPSWMKIHHVDFWATTVLRFPVYLLFLV